MLPSIEVKLADGQDCKGFHGKPITHPASEASIMGGTSGKLKSLQTKRAGSTQMWEA
jgi:hypothetical protein